MYVQLYVIPVSPVGIVLIRGDSFNPQGIVLIRGDSFNPQGDSFRGASKC